MFHIADSQDIKSGKITDMYFIRTGQVLRAKGIDKRAVAEVTLKGTPAEWSWGVLAGVEELAWLLRDLPIDVYAYAEGTLFDPGQPVVVLEGMYLDYCVYETALLGLLCQASGIATKASRCKKAAGQRQVLSFGARRMHPALAPMIERNAYIGGCDGVAVVKSGEMIGEPARGTMPHALILLIGDTTEAALAFHEAIEPAVKRVVLIDTLGDEKVEALKVAQAMGENLYGIRLDTPASRRGDLLQILKEVRWELDYRGFNHVKLFVSGGLDEYQIAGLNEGADAYGVGTSISNAPVVNFSFDIVEIDDLPIAKKGKDSGRKQVWRCRKCGQTKVLPAHHSGDRCYNCSGQCEALLKPLIKQGKLVADLPKPQEIRRYVLQQIVHRKLF
ncbi:MAG: nicotinate phosphoribosyltransferase [Candidatus Schekmanbacteria bacterium]|nr:nicotinate phosphoribosyltransferase [Candidatus Schekmanbacteria bacterium]